MLSSLGKYHKQRDGSDWGPVKWDQSDGRQPNNQRINLTPLSLSLSLSLQASWEDLGG